MKYNQNKKIFEKPVVHFGETKVKYVVCKSAHCSGSSTHVLIDKLDKITKVKVA